MLNKVTLIGNLGADPEIRHTQEGTTVATINLATSRRWKDKKTGEKRDETEWHRVILWGKVAEIAGEYLKKGGKAYIEGRLQTRKWTDKEGVERYTTEVVGENLLLLGDKGDRQESSSRPPQPPIPDNEPSSFGDFDDDIPF